MQDLNYTRGYAEINLNAIISNLQQMQEQISNDTKMMLIVKADGYGHGADPIAKLFEQEEQVWGYGVATVDEGILLRNAGIKKPILVLGCVFPDQYGAVIKHDIRINIYNKEMAHEIGKYARMAQKKALIHIKIDSGMSRLGFLCNENSVQDILEVAKSTDIQVEGIFTHFSKADESDKTYTKEQYMKFQQIINKLETLGLTFQYKHCSNSAAIIDHPECNMDLVRVGIALYGLYPSDEVQKEKIILEPALSWISSIASVKTIPHGTKVSYGGIYEALHDIRVATIPMGYADGYARALSNKGYVLIEGKKAKIIGKICMDQFMVDITDIPEADFMTPVVLIGKSKNEYLYIEELSSISDKFNYEFICGISKRIPRVYIKNGKSIDQIDYFA